MSVSDCAACALLRDNGFDVKCNVCLAREQERQGKVEKCTKCGRPLPGFAAIQHGGECVACFHK